MSIWDNRLKEIARFIGLDAPSVDPDLSQRALGTSVVGALTTFASNYQIFVVALLET